MQRDVERAVVAAIVTSADFRPPRSVPRGVAAHHLAVASMALVEWWLRHGMPYTPERMGGIYADLVVGPTRQA